MKGRDHRHLIITKSYSLPADDKREKIKRKHLGEYTCITQGNPSQVVLSHDNKSHEKDKRERENLESQPTDVISCPNDAELPSCPLAEKEIQPSISDEDER